MGTGVETGTSPDDIDPEGPVRTIRARSPSLIVIAFGLGLLTMTTWNFLREQQTLSVDLPPLAAAGIGLSLSVGLLYAGVWLARSDLDSDERWLVARVTVAGGAVFTGIILLTMLIRVAEGRAIAEAPFVLFTAAGGGGIAGSLVGGLYARARRDARVAEFARAEAEQARERAERARRDAEENQRQLEAAQAETERLLEEARQTKDDLRLINRVLRHDIKNSIMVIESRAEFLGDDLEDAATTGAVDDRAGEFLDTIVAQAEEIEREVERTGAVIETITDEDPDLQPTDLGAAIESQVATLRDSFDVEARVEGLERVADGDGGPSVLANQVLPDVLGNVLTNAVVHHGGDDPTVEVRVAADEETVTVSIADDGQGIPDERKSQVFHRGESSGDGGFGLFFVDRMMQQYGGNVRVEDADLGGAAFVFEFQRAE
ncbi:ATP-binding protein [Haloglomus litoreum]|uniref:ATP-binding protein n=1 Tax=Haloglomus litoreum TaxID=3034026 RepID=UPI0023E76919|nr:ATP-binding protein [Haloglomus sp. DT116]